MKNRGGTLLCLCISVIWLTTHVSAQSPFKASQGKATALSNAKSGGFPNATLTSIATLGDTTFFGSFIPAAVKSILRFDATKGTSSFWGYRFSDVVAGKDTTTAYVVIKPLITYLAIQTALPDLPSLPIRVDSALPATYMDSDLMCAKILATSAYKSYMLAHPNAKFQAAALGTSRGGTFPTGPLWVAFIGDALNNNSLSCFVEAATDAGSATCVELQTSDVTSAESSQSIQLYPNPSHSGDLFIHIPLDSYEPEVQLDLYSLLGEHMKSYGVRSVAGGVDIHVDCSSLPRGTYVLVLRGRQQPTKLPFSID